MNKRKFFVVVVWIIFIFVILFSLFLLYYSSPQEDSSQDGSNGDNQDTDEANSDVYWGVDSANSVDKDLYQCVTDNYGEPEVLGRYLGDIEDVSQGLNSDEIDFLQEQDVKILIIYNLIENATDYNHGADHASKAIDYAKDLDVPDGVAIFADIEPKFHVDSAFIEGWYDTLSESAYESGLYGVFDEDSKIVEAYNATKEKTRKNTVIWSAYPQEGITSKKNAPKFNPDGPKDAMTNGWQYGQESEECDIDTNLFNKDMLDYLW